jgi:superfamily II DNA or RNA helicase
VRLPYVIDNQEHRLADILNGLLAEHGERSLDVATAYFTVGGFELLREKMLGLGNFRLLLGAEPTAGEQAGLRPQSDVVKGLLRQDLEALPFDEATLRAVEELIAFLQRESVQVRLHDKGFLHAKCWLFYSDRPGQQMLFDRFRPITAIVGSSNFTIPGLTSNRELNLAHKVLLDPSDADDRQAAQAVSWLTEAKASERISPENRQLVKSEVGARAIIDLERWYEAQWVEARDYKQELIDLLDASKFGRKEYTPYQVYMKALYEYFKDDLAETLPVGTRSAVDLAEFQEDAVKRARRILARYDGVMVADSVGLGKTWIGKKLLEDFAYHMRQKALVICPASLREMWGRELHGATIAAQILSQESLGQEDFDPVPWGDADVILVDESHNFRNRNTNRYGSIERVLGANGGRGRDGSRKKVILLTATPINNDLFDLYNQLSLVTRGDRSYFSACGIGDLYRYFLQARRESRTGGDGLAIFNLLEEMVIRRTRPHIRQAYPNATIRGKPVTFPDRKLKTVQYDLESTYAGIYEEVVSGVESLTLAPYNLEAYKKTGVEVNEFEAGREQALVGIFKSQYLKRFESSIEAFRISVRRALAFLKTFESYILGGKLMRSSDFHKAMRYLEREDVEDDATPGSLATEMDADEEATQVLAGMEEVNTADYDLRRLHEAVENDVQILTGIWARVKDIGPAEDAKLQQLKALLAGELLGKKVLVFTYYRDTARYLYRHLGQPDSSEATEFRRSLGGATIRRIDGGYSPSERERLIQAFAPRSNNRPDLVGADNEIDVLLSTDVLSEGQNLQDCGYLVNYDLHWNPTRMVQRAGRIDRIGTEFDTLWIYNMFPEEGLERLLGLVESLSRKICDIDRAGFLDASILGETVHPQNFNTLRRIRDEDGKVIEEEEQFAELASSEGLLQQLRGLLDAGGQEMLEGLPDGIHSGLVREGSRGVFFYFQGRPAVGEKLHFWKYYDLKDENILDNRYVIANLIACDRDTARVVEPGMFGSVFDLQEKVIEDILKSFQEQQALESAPKSLDPIQQTVATAIQGYINHPGVDRSKAIETIRFLNQPMFAVQVRELRRVYRQFRDDRDIHGLLAALSRLRAEVGNGSARETSEMTGKLTRGDLQLICFDFLSGG